MRLLTRSDFDGLACAVILREVENIETIEFCHPKDMQDGKIDVTSNDIITNLPFNAKAGMWFDHHASQSENANLNAASNAGQSGTVKGRYVIAPSTARVIYDYYTEQGFEGKLKKFEAMLHDADRVDSADLTVDDVTNPKGWILLSYLMDPRTGLGKLHDYETSNRDLMMKFIDWIPKHTAEEIIEFSDVKPRIDRYFSDEARFKAALLDYSYVDRNVVITNLRGVETPIGNRFLIYTLFPEANISLRIIDGKKGSEVIVIAVGYSIFNRTSKTHIGALMSKYGGGGHEGAGTCQVPVADASNAITEIIEQMKKDG